MCLLHALLALGDKVGAARKRRAQLGGRRACAVVEHVDHGQALLAARSREELCAGHGAQKLMEK